MTARGRDILGHPRGLTILAAAEAWERFSFYGLQALLTLYMVRELLLPGHAGRVAGLAALRHALQGGAAPISDQALASAIFGLYGGAIYLSPILGGLVADRWLGRRRTIVLGAVLMAAGHFLMSFEPPFLLALACMVLGAGCFKGNIAAQVGALYAPGDQRRADAFQIFYAGINTGAIFAPLVCGTLGEDVGWRYGFAVAGVGMLVGLAIYLAGWRDLPPETAAPAPDGAKTASAPLSRHEWKVVLLLFGLLPFLALGLVANQQLGNAYLLWARSHIDTRLFGHALPLTWLLSLETLATLACLAGSARFWTLWARRRREPDEMTKVVLGQALMTAAPLVLAAASAITATTGRTVSLAWPVGFSLLNEIGFANVLPVTLALYTRLAPRPLTGAIVGVYYLQLVGANLLAGALGGLLDKLPATAFWGLHAGLAAVATLALLAVRLRLRGLYA
ncbi:peptide MFS transporter [Caulobacter sp. KR2-114]|uniref:peptide MFS transporter n=1 Tax=Caulobacter sp. KR2-114 TaxID=3400912 RepID=UPI003BFEB909